MPHGPAPAARQKLPDRVPVDVVIPCHNYGRFLADCIRSVQSQDVRVASITVVDDSSTDNTREVAESLGVKYIRIDERNVYLARQAGLRATSAEFVVFLDADDMLAPDYVSATYALAAADESIAIVHSDLRQFGSVERIVKFQPCNIERANHIHAGALVRRLALNVTGAYDCPVPGCNSHADWYVWRHVIRAGWGVAKVPKPLYLYRRHPDSMMQARGHGYPYYIEASLGTEPITLVIPFSGRLRFFRRLTEWAARQTRVTDLLVIDSSTDVSFRWRLRQWLAWLDLRSVNLVTLPPSNGLADSDRRGANDAYRAVQRAMPRIYQHLRNCPTEYLMIVEDDVLPPDDAIEALLRSMGEDVAAVSGAVPSRWNTSQAIACDTSRRSLLLAEDTGGLQEVGGTGFGCLLLRRSAVLGGTPFHNGGVTQNYDIEFSRRSRELCWRWLMDWRIKCKHG